MKKLFIENVQCGISEGGFACGPIPGHVVAEVRVKLESGESCFFSIVDIEGMPNIYRTEESIYDRLIEEDEDDEEMMEILDKGFIDLGDYDDIFRNPDPEWHDLYRLLISVARADWDTTEQLIQAATGKFLDEIDIPVSDVEEESC